MRTQFFAAVATTMLVSLAVSAAPASAKTKKECTKEWQADKVAMQAAGKTEKAYVAECRGPAVTAAATAASSKQAPKQAPKQPVKEDKGGY